MNYPQVILKDCKKVGNIVWRWRTISEGHVEGRYDWSIIGLYYIDISHEFLIVDQKLFFLSVIEHGIEFTFHSL